MTDMPRRILSKATYSYQIARVHKRDSSKFDYKAYINFSGRKADVGLFYGLTDSERLAGATTDFYVKQQYYGKEQ